MKLKLPQFLLLFLIQIPFFAEGMDLILKRAENIIEQYKHNSKEKKPIISIAGGSSVGKTYFSEKLLHALISRGIRAKILPLDYFFIPNSQLEYSLQPSEFNSRVGHQVWQFDHRNAHQVLQDIVVGKSLIFEPHLDFETQIRTFSTKNYAETDIVILEGIYALSGSDGYDFTKYSSLKIFMDVDKKRLLDWYCTRKRDKGPSNPEEDPVTIWDFEEDYKKVIAPTKANADIIIQQDERREYY